MTWLIAVAVGGGGAWAATIRGSDRSDRLTGTAGPDAMFGHGGNDVLAGLAGADLLDGGPGRDALSGGTGADRIWVAEDGTRDTVACGPGQDLVGAEPVDAVAADCETVVRQLSRDPSTAGAQHESQVEPASAGAGKTVVAAFQSGRYESGGAAAIGYATSSDAGASWRSGFLPGLTVSSTPAGENDLASDPSVAYDPVHRVWLIASLTATRDRLGIQVSRSRDGLSWSHPVPVVTAAQDGIDKDWVACDTWQSSPFRGRCYVSFLDVPARRIVTSASSDGGLTWTAPVAPPGPLPGSSPNGALPLVRPDGTLVVLYSSLYGQSLADDEILAARSTDGGATFSPPVRVSHVQMEEVYELRSPVLPAGGVDAGGRLYVVWQDCRFDENCDVVDLVLSTSDDGVTWSPPRRIPTTAPAARIHSLVPGFAVDATTRGTGARLALVYYTLPHDCVLDLTCPGIDAYTIASRNGGATWGRPERLSPEPMRFNWIAESTLGRMLGDYEAVSFAGGRAVPVFALASEPAADGTFRQAIFARARG